MTEPVQSTVTEFEQSVYDACRRIPKGRVTTYKLLAEAVGRGNGRAVGQALRKNPFAPVVPCHRVVRTDLSLGGFMGKTRGEQVQRKRRMLEKEGVRFAGSERVEPEAVYRF